MLNRADSYKEKFAIGRTGTCVTVDPGYIRFLIAYVLQNVCNHFEVFLTGNINFIIFLNF